MRCEVTSDARAWGAAARLAGQSRAIAVPLRVGAGRDAQYVIAIAPCEHGPHARHSATLHAVWRWTVVHWPARPEHVSAELVRVAVLAAREHCAALVRRMVPAQSEPRSPARLGGRALTLAIAAAERAKVPPPSQRRRKRTAK